jgi:hypothetical protein
MLDLCKPTGAVATNEWDKGTAAIDDVVYSLFGESIGTTFTTETS